MLQVLTVTAASELAEALALRRRVFVDEQGVPEQLELDAHDRPGADCHHVLARLDGQPAGTARYRTTEGGIKIERVAVEAGVRGRGVGLAIVMYILGELDGSDRPYVHAQASAWGFWEHVGFVPRGPIFQEAAIDHRRMDYDRSP
ncbi:MAG: GNAT family N-acetyltransferase [Myxococcales bacterium]|nr:GNAT family N-acetyltransferase [Myxococcales bacterium]